MHENGVRCDAAEVDDLRRGAFAGVRLVQSDYGSDLVEPACGAGGIYCGAVQPDPAGGGKPEGVRV